ncbi:hypothetical protein QOT17_012019 [Balamuthia mandrillaris]
MEDLLSSALPELDTNEIPVMAASNLWRTPDSIVDDCLFSLSLSRSLSLSLSLSLHIALVHELAFGTTVKGGLDRALHDLLDLLRFTQVRTCGRKNSVVLLLSTIFSRQFHPLSRTELNLDFCSRCSGEGSKELLS